MYRHTYAEINLNNIKNNAKWLKQNLKDYKYHIAVVKADAYNHDSVKTVKALLDGGINFLAVATLEEALIIRKTYKEIPILCLGIIEPKYLKICEKNNITVTISNLDYVKKIKTNNLKVHIKINTGMNRLGISDISEFKECVKTLKEKNIFIEGIYTHIYNDKSVIDTKKQIELFKSFISILDIPIVHIGASFYALNYPKEKEINGVRYGLALYGLANNLKNTFRLISEVIQINYSKGTVGYNAAYKTKGNEYIAVIPIGYADGISRNNTGRNVFINNKPYKIVGNICMDMLMVKVDETVKVGDKVEVIKDNEHILEIAKHLNTISYEVICQINKRVPKKYI